MTSCDESEHQISGNQACESKHCEKLQLKFMARGWCLASVGMVAMYHGAVPTEAGTTETDGGVSRDMARDF